MKNSLRNRTRASIHSRTPRLPLNVSYHCSSRRNNSILVLLSPIDFTTALYHSARYNSYFHEANSIPAAEKGEKAGKKREKACGIDVTTYNSRGRCTAAKGALCFFPRHDLMHRCASRRWYFRGAACPRIKDTPFRFISEKRDIRARHAASL